MSQMFKTTLYTPSDWYWSIGGDEANVWSSKRAKSVPIADVEYTAWFENIGGPSRIATMDELRDLLRVQYPPGTFETYTADVRFKTMGGGITVNGRPFATDTLTLSSLNSAYIYTQTNQGATFSWKLPDGTFVTLNKQDVQTLQGAVSSHGQACFDVEADMLDGIAAGTITTHAAIDTAFAAIDDDFTGIVLQDRKKK